MKAVCLLDVILLMICANSCTSYYYVVTDVSGDMTVSRKVHADLSEENAVFPEFASGGRWKGHVRLSDPFVVDFYDETVLMTDFSEIQCDNIDDLKYMSNNKDAGIAFPEPVETLAKRFRWFYTYYDYTAVFKGIHDRLPLPFDGYLTESQRELLFRGGDVPEGWNGVEMYLLLDDLNRRLASWYSDMVYFVMCDILEPYCRADQVAFMDASRKAFMERTDKEVMFAMEPDEFVQRLAEIAPDMGFDEVYGKNVEAVEKAYGKQAEILDCFASSFVYALDMPGRYYDGNAAVSGDGKPQWKVDAYRLLAGDLVLEAVFRKVNIWAFFLTFALVGMILFVAAKGFSG